MDVQLRLELVRGCLSQLAVEGVACACHQHLDFPKRVDRLCDEGIHRVGVGDVELESDCLATVGSDLADEVLELSHTAGAQRDGESTRREFDRRGFSDPGGGAGDDYGPSV